MSDLYSEILEFTKMKNIDREQLVEDYIQQLIEGMDYKTMECLVYDTLKDNLADILMSNSLQRLKNTTQNCWGTVRPCDTSSGGT